MIIKASEESTASIFRVKVMIAELVIFDCTVTTSEGKNSNVTKDECGLPASKINAFLSLIYMRIYTHTHAHTIHNPYRILVNATLLPMLRTITVLSIATYTAGCNKI